MSEPLQFIIVLSAALRATGRLENGNGEEPPGVRIRRSCSYAVSVEFGDVYSSVIGRR
jgi:hypothetical protein